jgi:acetylornithine/N-succinyldiaminopimelate aminotransferase
MQLFNVYPLYDIEPVKAQGSRLWDSTGKSYLDMYGGHAVISIGHGHPHYVAALQDQLQRIAFYSNSVKISIQERLAEKLGQLSGHEDYALFLTNSGAESNENALKLASFYNGRTEVIAFQKGFHGRTSGAVAATDNPSIVAPINATGHVKFLPYNDREALRQAVTDRTCAVILEGIQGVGGIHVATDEFLKTAREVCDQTGAVLILDSVQCGYGRSGQFFSHQYAGITADLMTTAKGMGNGFPIGGVLIAPKFQPKHGMLGTTFGGNHLACAAALAVLEVMEQEQLVQNAAQMGDYLLSELAGIGGIKQVRGRGLMIGIETEAPIDAIRQSLLFDHGIFTGVAGKHTLRLLPSLAIDTAICDEFLTAFRKVMQ